MLKHGLKFKNFLMSQRSFHSDVAYRFILVDSSYNAEVKLKALGNVDDKWTDDFEFELFFKIFRGISESVLDSNYILRDSKKLTK